MNRKANFVLADVGAIIGVQRRELVAAVRIDGSRGDFELVFMRAAGHWLKSHDGNFALRRHASRIRNLAADPLHAWWPATSKEQKTANCQRR